MKFTSITLFFVIAVGVNSAPQDITVPDQKIDEINSFNGQDGKGVGTSGGAIGDGQVHGACGNGGNCGGATGAGTLGGAVYDVLEVVTDALGGLVGSLLGE